MAPNLLKKAGTVSAAIIGKKSTSKMHANETLINSILLMVLQAHHERNQRVTVHPELVEGFNQRHPKVSPTRRVRFNFLHVLK
jgi:hypothetical protein